MRTLLILLASFTLASNSWAQGFNGHARISANFALQRADLRMDGLGPGLARELLKANPWSDYQIGFMFLKPFLQRDDLSIEWGIGYSRETSTFYRPFQSHYFGILNRRMHYLGKYHNHQLMLPLSWRKRVVKLNSNGMLFLSLDVLTGLHFYKKVIEVVPSAREEKIQHTHSRFDLSLHAMEVNPGLGLRLGRWETTLSYRAFQIMQIDPVVFQEYHLYPSDSNPFPLPGYETHNPFKLWLSLSYDLGPDFSLRGLLRR